MSTDEDKMIKKLEEHRDVTKLIVEIGELYGINVTPTVNNNPNGDFQYKKDDEQELKNAIDKYLGNYKYRKDDSHE
jgi:hypothetical protein